MMMIMMNQLSPEGAGPFPIAQYSSHAQCAYFNCMVEFYNIVRVIDNNQASPTSIVKGRGGFRDMPSTEDLSS